MYLRNWNKMGRGVPITPTKEEEIIAALEATPHASRVAQKLGVSFSTVWRRADRAGIELTAGRAAKGYKRLPVERYAKIIAVRQANPKATQEEVAREAGVSRPTLSRVTRGHHRRAGVSPAGSSRERKGPLMRPWWSARMAVPRVHCRKRGGVRLARQEHWPAPPGRRHARCE